MLLEYLPALNGNFMISSILKDSPFCGVLIGMAISSNQRNYKTENIASSTCPTIMALATA